MPWETEAIAGGAAVSAFVSLLKRLGLPSAYAPMATWACGLAWLVASKLARGEDWGKAVGGAIIVILSAPGFYELFSKPLKKALVSEAGK